MKKARFCLAFFDLQKKPKVFKEARISHLASKKPNLLATLLLSTYSAKNTKLTEISLPT